MSRINFSVVIPLYNKQESVSRTLTSVCNQRFSATEIIVVDDGSTDASAAKVIALKIPNLRLVKQDNQGVSAARNRGVLLAKSKYVAFLDADDQWSPFYLHEMNKLIKQFPEQKCFASRYQKVLNNGGYADPKLAIGDISPTGYVMDNYFELCAKGDLPFMPSSLVMEKALFRQLGGFPVGEAMGEDQALFSQIALQASLAYSPLILMLYHTESENRACDRHTPDQVLPFAQRLLNAVAANEIDKNTVPFVKQYCAAHICHLAKINIHAGKFAVARQLLQHPVSHLKPLHRHVFSMWLIAQYLSPKLVNLAVNRRQYSNPNSLY